MAVPFLIIKTLAQGILPAATFWMCSRRITCITFNCCQWEVSHTKSSGISDHSLRHMRASCTSCRVLYSEYLVWGIWGPYVSETVLTDTTWFGMRDWFTDTIWMEWSTYGQLMSHVYFCTVWGACLKQPFAAMPFWGSAWGSLAPRSLKPPCRASLLVGVIAWRGTLPGKPTPMLFLQLLILQRVRFWRLLLERICFWVAKIGSVFPQDWYFSGLIYQIPHFEPQNHADLH